jgi:predicted acetyltransferase
MTDIRRLTPEELSDFVPIAANAYPDFHVNTAEERQKLVERWQGQLADATTSFHGAFRDGKLLGGMKHYDFQMTIFGAQVPTGGVGLVAVDLHRKKERVAYGLIQYFLHHYRERGAPLVELYPFRPDFYQQMGFGYGTKQSQYHVLPGDLPQAPTREHVRALVATEDLPLLMDCYNRYQQRRHGMIARSQLQWQRILGGAEQRAAGCLRDGRLTGYLMFSFQPGAGGNWFDTDLTVEELVAETPEALAELLAFLRVQADQIRRITVNTQDEDFHFLPRDPRNGTGHVLPPVCHESNTQGVGLMYRVVDVPGIFAALAEHDFGGQTLRLQLTIRDSFYPENDGAVVVHFNAGHPLVVGDSDSDAQVGLDVADFSSLLMGCVSFKSLYRYGRVTLSDTSYLDTLHRMFLAEEKPICMTVF